MPANAPELILREQKDNIRNVQALLSNVQALLISIAKFDPGGWESRLAVMAEKQLDDIHEALDKLP